MDGPTPPGFYDTRFDRLGVITNDTLTIGPFEDWSQVRSHGRAARRRKQGHPQRIRIYFKPNPDFYRYGDMIIGHPETIQRLMAAVKARS